MKRLSPLKLFVSTPLQQFLQFNKQEIFKSKNNVEIDKPFIERIHWIFFLIEKQI